MFLSCGANDNEGAIRGFILDEGTQGLTAPAIRARLGVLASLSGEISMDGLLCPEENAFLDVRGLKGTLTCLESARYGVPWGAHGAGEGCRGATCWVATASARNSARHDTSSTSRSSTGTKARTTCMR